MKELEFFYQLKKELLQKYRETYPEWERSIHDFRGKEIANFQKLLEEKVHSRISEKWFYTHIKPTENTKLPRMDMLDLLSQFLGFSDWEKFKKQQQIKEQKEFFQNEKIKEEKHPVVVPFSKKKIAILGAMFFGMILLAASFFSEKNNGFTFCFEDSDTHKMIKNQPIEIKIFQEGESPIIQKIDSKGCFKWQSKTEKITFAIHAPYYRPDTITRVLQNKKHHEMISLKKDDYALMIHFFSTSNIKDWKKRRQQLAEMIADDAVIFQVAKGKTMMGLDMLNKEEFIDRLTLPMNSLENIKIIHSMYREGRIYRLRFIVE
ncbi:MAG TPA: hypothetical protein ENJ53_11250 [Phaeodactylibacter sp.]|nr:hypothetical protein [Phaeodactylibacter sp.]